MIRVECPKCHQKFEITRKEVGTQIACPHCLHPFRARPVRETPAPKKGLSGLLGKLLG